MIGREIQVLGSAGFRDLSGYKIAVVTERREWHEGAKAAQSGT